MEDNNNENNDQNARRYKMMCTDGDRERSSFTVYDAAIIVIIAVALYLAFGK